MNELSLFSGAGGGLLGTRLLGWTHVGYVEWDRYCQGIIAQRIQDGYLNAAPIFTDVREFVQSGAAEQYRGIADVVTGGFPCQPFSAAGLRRGADDPRNMWPATIDVVRAVRPEWCFFENVRGLLNSGYFDTVADDLAKSGYDIRWRVLSAGEVGAPHLRRRLWIVAHDNSRRCEQRQSQPEREVQQPYSQCGWPVEPTMGRVVHGYAGRVAEIRAAGNAQVPRVVAAAWRLLNTEPW